MIDDIVLPEDAKKAAKIGGLFCVGWVVFSDCCYDYGPTTEKLCKSKYEAEKYAREIKRGGRNYSITPIYASQVDPLNKSIF